MALLPDCRVMDINQEVELSPKASTKHVTETNLLTNNSKLKKHRAPVEVVGRHTTLGSAPSEESSELLIGENDENFITSMSKAEVHPLHGSSKKSVTQLQDPSSAIMMNTSNLHSQNQTGRASATKHILNMGIPPLAPMSQALGSGGAKSTRSISSQKKMLQKNVKGALLHSYALQGRRMNIEDGPPSARQNAGDSQQSI